MLWEGTKGERDERGERRDFDEPGDDPCAGADLTKPEEADAQRQQVPTEGCDREPSARCRSQAATRHEDDQAKAKRRDHLEQEQPTDRRDRSVTGEVQIEMDCTGREQQPGADDAQSEPFPVRPWPRPGFHGGRGYFSNRSHASVVPTNPLFPDIIVCSPSRWRSFR